MSAVPAEESYEGVDSFIPGGGYTFGRNLTHNEFITITFTGPACGFVVNVTNYEICVEEIRYCNISSAAVENAIGYLTKDKEFGVSTDDGTKIYWTENATEADKVQDGVKIKGHCFICECKDMVLNCVIDRNCSCPPAEKTCEGECGNAVEQYSYNVSGVNKNCSEPKPCTPEGCTTPFTCPGVWSEWSKCTDCISTRSRTCDKTTCGGICDNTIKTVESEECGSCVTTTPSVCSPPEVFIPCYNYTRSCSDKCMMINQLDACVETTMDNSCKPGCGCMDGYKKNTNGDCIKEKDCPCYDLPNTTPYPEGTTIYYNDTCSKKTCRSGSFVHNNLTCDEDAYTCNNATHQFVPSNETCTCGQCEPRTDVCKEKVVETRTLNFTTTEDGLCVSGELDVKICQGSCGASKQITSFTQTIAGAGSLPSFGLEMKSDCECCSANTEEKEVEFTCANSPNKMIKVTSIASCSCTQCGE